MLTILIKAYCIKVLVNVKPIHLNKHYFKDKIFCLDLLWLKFCEPIIFIVKKIFIEIGTKEARVLKNLFSP